MKALTKSILLTGSLLFLIPGCKNETPSSSSEITNEKTNTIKVEDVKYSVTENKVHTNNLGSMSLTNKDGYFAVEFPCEGKDVFKVSFEVSDTSLLGFAIINKEHVAIKQFNPYNKNGTFAALTKYIDVEISCPEDASYVYINCKSSFKDDFKVQKVSIVEEDVDKLNTIEQSSIFIGANNIGEFDYGDSSYTNEEYKTHWTNMLNEKKYNMFFFEDCIPTYSDGTPIKDVLGANKNHFEGIDSFGSYFHLSSNESPLYQSLVLLPHTIRAKSTRRYIAYKTVYSIQNKLTAFYAVHIVAENHINVTDSNGNYYLSQRLRQEQFQTLREDAKRYDESCIIGDFNTQSIAEYQSFLDEGYSIGNGSKEFGTKNTLIRSSEELANGKKDIPADNVVVTSGIKIKSFDVLDGFKLNTDHYPIYAELSFGEKI